MHQTYINILAVVVYISVLAEPSTQFRSCDSCSGAWRGEDSPMTSPSEATCMCCDEFYALQIRLIAY
ncbi:hypothetical protein E2C01_096161 [Portunus trituberculatus]|uniref:Secreted protein n=1 Tax=Portunus trituberculatus TaxID=210409 RepID=A0A5B7JX97_PORTR|nr:hypothetical protein [Portunus trituberculatus]